MEKLHSGDPKTCKRRFDLQLSCRLKNSVHFSESTTDTLNVWSLVGGFSPTNPFEQICEKSNWIIFQIFGMNILKKYTLWKMNMKPKPTAINHFERKMIWTKPLWLCSSPKNHGISKLVGTGDPRPLLYTSKTLYSRVQWVLGREYLKPPPGDPGLPCLQRFPSKLDSMSAKVGLEVLPKSVFFGWIFALKWMVLSECLMKNIRKPTWQAGKSPFLYIVGDTVISSKCGCSFAI